MNFENSDLKIELGIFFKNISTSEFMYKSSEKPKKLEGDIQTIFKMNSYGRANYFLFFRLKLYNEVYECVKYEYSSKPTVCSGNFYKWNE